LKYCVLLDQSSVRLTEAKGSWQQVVRESFPTLSSGSQNIDFHQVLCLRRRLSAHVCLEDLQIKRKQQQ